MAKTKAEIQREYEKRTGYSAQKKYAKEKLKRIPLDVSHEDYDKIKNHAEKISESVRGFILRSVFETMERDNDKTKPKNL